MLGKLEALACDYFKITLAEMRSPKRTEELYTARHVFRTTAVKDYGFTEADVSEWQGVSRGAVYNSIANVIDKKQYALQYIDFLKCANAGIVKKTKPVEIERLTDEAFDQRFYKHPEKINVRTGNNYFPAYHFITGLGAPENAGLSKWRQDKGHYADTIMVRTAEIGSFVHDSIDSMLKNGTEVKHETIHQLFPDDKEAQRVKQCLLGFLTFMSDQEPEIISTESMHCADDFGFTLDMECRLKEDDYKGKWVVDWKTSKVASDEHKMQVEVIRRITKADKGAVIILGNTTKKGYTFSPLQASKGEFLWKLFCAIRETAYVKILESNMIKPRENNMPKSFSLKDIKYTKI